MNKIIKMTKVELEAAFGFSSMLYDIKQNKKNLRKPLFTLVIIACVLPAYVLLFALVKMMYSVFASIGTPESVLALGVVATTGITFVFGLMYTFGALFNSKDLNMLLAMPVKADNIVASKLIYCVIIEYLFTLPVMLPFVYYYFSMFGAGVIGILYAVIMTLFLPVIPIALTAIVEILLIRLFGMRVSAEKVQTVFMFVGLFFGLGISFISQSFGKYNTSEISYVLLDKAALFNSISNGYFPSKYFAHALTNVNSINGLLFFLLFVLISAALFFLTIKVAGRYYITAVTSGNLITSAKVKKEKITDYTRGAMKPTNKAFAIFKYDMLIMLRTSIFMFNTIFIIPLLPIVFAVSFIMQGKELISKLQALVMNMGEISGVFYLMIILFMIGITACTSTSYSREGQGFWIDQIIPVTPKEQLLGRCLSSVIINSCLYIVCVIPVAIIVKWSFTYSLLLIISGMIFTLPPSIIGLIIDIIRPKLDWDDPAKAVKQNLNSFFNFIITLFIAGIFSAITYVLFMLTGKTMLILLILCVIALAISFLLTKLYYKQHNKHLSFK